MNEINSQYKMQRRHMHNKDLDEQDNDSIDNLSAERPYRCEGYGGKHGKCLHWATKVAAYPPGKAMESQLLCALCHEEFLEDLHQWQREEDEQKQ
jgi:hypothetical protein